MGENLRQTLTCLVQILLLLVVAAEGDYDFMGFHIGLLVAGMRTRRFVGRDTSSDATLRRTRHFVGRDTSRPY